MYTGQKGKVQNRVLGGDIFCPRLRFLQAWLQNSHPGHYVKVQIFD